MRYFFSFFLFSFPLHSPHYRRHHSHDDFEHSFEEVDHDLAFLPEGAQERAEHQAEENYAQRVSPASVLRHSHQFLVADYGIRGYRNRGEVLEGRRFWNVYRVGLRRRKKIFIYLFIYLFNSPKKGREIYLETYLLKSCLEYIIRKHISVTHIYIYIFFIISIRSIDGRFIDDTAYIIPLADGMHSEQAWLKRTGK